MPGYNHRSDCTCGWCIGGWRNHDTLPVASTAPAIRVWAIWGNRWVFESFTVPNARCHYCGASIFFYRSLHGGRVFFNEPGPPWDKHECYLQPVVEPARPHENRIFGHVDDPSLVGRHETQPILEQRWARSGHRPITVDSVESDDDGWHVLKCHRLNDGGYFRVLATSQPENVVGAPIHISEFDELEFATLSYLDARGAVRTVPVYDYGIHCLFDPEEVQR